MRESRTYGSVRGALSNERPYRDPRDAASTSRSSELAHTGELLEDAFSNRGRDEIL
jgi:hypothetical protein